MEDLSESSLNTLIKNGILEEFDVIVSRFEAEKITDTHKIQLSVEQLTYASRNSGRRSSNRELRCYMELPEAEKQRSTLISSNRRWKVDHRYFTCS